MRVLLVVFVSVLFLSVAFNCGSSKKVKVEELVDNEIVAQLKGKVKPEQVIGAYQKYKIKTIKMVEKSTNSWLFSFDNNLITPEEMLFIMQNSQFVSSARFNQKEE